MLLPDECPPHPEGARVGDCCQWPVCSPRRRPAVLPTDGHEYLLNGGQITPRRGWVGQFNGLTPLPEVAWASRKLSPWVTTMRAWWGSRSTVAVARVLGMISPNPSGSWLEVCASGQVRGHGGGGTQPRSRCQLDTEGASDAHHVPDPVVQEGAQRARTGRRPRRQPPTAASPHRRSCRVRMSWAS